MGVFLFMFKVTSFMTHRIRSVLTVFSCVLHWYKTKTASPGPIILKRKADVVQIIHNKAISFTKARCSQKIQFVEIEEATIISTFIQTYTCIVN